MLSQIVLRHYLLQGVHETMTRPEGLLLSIIAGIGVIAALHRPVFQLCLQLKCLAGQSCVLLVHRESGELAGERDDLGGLNGLGGVIAGVVLYAAVGLHHL